MARSFAVVRTRGPAWDANRTLEAQPDWLAHAAFMEALHADGFVVLVGPLDGTPDVLLIARADSAEEIRSRLAADPWEKSAQLRTLQVTPWTIRLGSLEASRA